MGWSNPVLVGIGLIEELSLTALSCPYGPKLKFYVANLSGKQSVISTLCQEQLKERVLLLDSIEPNLVKTTVLHGLTYGGATGLRMNFELSRLWPFHLRPTTVIWKREFNSKIVLEICSIHSKKFGNHFSGIWNTY